MTLRFQGWLALQGIHLPDHGKHRRLYVPSGG